MFPAVPFIFHSLAETRRAERADMQSLRLCISAGAPLSQATYDLFHDRFGRPIRQLYGCSEAGSVTINLGDNPTGSWDSVGTPMRGIDIALIGEDGVRHARGASGEIVFRSDALTAGYVGEGETTNEVFDGGWFRTGDVGRIDGSGNLFVTGRTKLFISTSGFKVDPFEVEAVLRTQPGVGDVVVVGAHGDRGEEIVKAVVVPDHADARRVAPAPTARDGLPRPVGAVQGAADRRVPRRDPPQPIGQDLAQVPGLMPGSDGSGLTGRPPFPFIVGCGRSGSTLLRAMCDGHPDLAVPPESHFVVQLAPRGRAANRPFDARAFVDQLGASDRFRLWEIDREVLTEAFAASRPEDYPQAVRQVFGLWAATRGKSRYADKTPVYVLHMPRAGAPVPGSGVRPPRS